MDAVFHWRGIPHKHEVPVLDGKFIADFVIGEPGKETIVEIVGMLDYSRYARKFWEGKHKAYNAAALPVAYYVAAAVDREYNGCTVPLNIQSTRRCSECGKRNHDLVKGLCRTPCYMNMWHRSHAIKLCRTCDGEFTTEGQYCSRECYWKSLVVDNPSAQTRYMRKHRGGLYEERSKL